MTRTDVPDRISSHRRAFVIVAAIVGIAGIVFSVPFWVVSLLDEQDIHRMHNTAFLALYAILLGAPLVLAARRPELQASAFAVAAASGVAATVTGLISGDFVSGVWYPAPITVALLIALHPARSVLRPGGVDPLGAALAVIALVPAVAFALTQARLQREGVPADPHHEFHHYSGMAATSLALASSAAAAALRLPGRRTGIWLAAAAAVVVGGGSLVFDDFAGALDPLWAWLTAAWGIALAAAGSISRREPAAATA